MSGGKINRDVWDLILYNVRTPQEREGDLAAMFGSNRNRRAAVDGDRHEVWLEGSQPLHHRDPELQRADDSPRDRSIPDGTYEAEDFLDNDGITDKPIAIRVKVTH